MCIRDRWPGQTEPEVPAGKSGRKPGGQSGHGGQTLAQVSDPDEVLRHEPTRCRGCGAGLGRAPEVGVARRQVFDLPPISIRVTEHELCLLYTSDAADDLTRVA